MTNIQILLELQANGKLKKMFRSGLIPCKYSSYMEIYLYYDAKMSVGSKKMSVIADIEDKFNVGQTTIYKALKLMNE